MCKAFAAVITALLLITSPALAQSVCGDRAKVVSGLAEKYQEVPAAFGIIEEKNLLEVLVSGTGSWTILVTRPDGRTCIAAAGQSWEQVPATGKMTGL